MERKEPGLMEKKMEERIRYAIDMVKKEAKKEDDPPRTEDI